MQLPPLTRDDRAAIAEAIEERAAIREYEGGESRAIAEREARAAMRAYRVLVAMGEGESPRWATMLAPGCDLAEARVFAERMFIGRVIEIVEQRRR